MMSFRATGTPCSGPLWRPARISLSASDASSSARSAVTVIKEFVSSASIRPSNTLTTSTGERRLARSSLNRPASERGRSVYWAKSKLLLGWRCAVSHSVQMRFRYYRRVIARTRKTLFRFDRRVWLLLFAMLAFRFGHGLYFPFSSIYFHNVLGIPLSLIGIGLAVFAAASVLSGLVAGPLTDRYGRKPMMLAALAGSSVSFFAFSLVGGVAGYLAVSAAHGFVGLSMFEASRNAMVADVTPQGLRSRAFGLVRVGGNVGWARGPSVVGCLPEALRRNLCPDGGGGGRAGPWHQGITPRGEGTGGKQRVFRQVARGVLGRAFRSLARGRGLALLRFYAGLAGIADLCQELRRGGRRADRVLPGGQRAYDHTLSASDVVLDRPRLQGRRVAGGCRPLRRLIGSVAADRLVPRHLRRFRLVLHAGRDGPGGRGRFPRRRAGARAAQGHLSRSLRGLLRCCLRLQPHRRRNAAPVGTSGCDLGDPARRRGVCGGGTPDAGRAPPIRRWRVGRARRGRRAGSHPGNPGRRS